MRNRKPATTPLARWMEIAGKTDEEVAAQVSVSRVQITRIRTGANKPSRSTAVELEKVTGIPAVKLIFGEATA